MAGDWIKVETCTPDKPEVYQISEILGIDPDAVIGKLFRIWVWADQQTIDGNASSVTKTLLDRVTGVSGFTEAMEQVGWLKKTNGGFQLPNFDRHNGQTAKKRSQTAKRVQKHRDPDSKPSNAKRNARSVTKTLPEKEKRRDLTTEGEPQRKLEHLIPSKLSDAECSAAAEKWFAYLASKGLEDKSPEGNEIALEEWWRQMAKFTRSDFLEAVSESIAGGRWNVTKSRQQANGSSKKDGYPDDLLLICTTCKQYPQDIPKRKEILGPKLFEIAKRLQIVNILDAIGNDWKMKSLVQFYSQHLKDIESHEQ